MLTEVRDLRSKHLPTASGKHAHDTYAVIFPLTAMLVVTMYTVLICVCRQNSLWLMLSWCNSTLNKVSCILYLVCPLNWGMCRGVPIFLFLFFFFFFLLQNIDCGYSLEPPRHGQVFVTNFLCASKTYVKVNG